MWLEVALVEYVFTLVNWEIRAIRWMPHELNDESQNIECEYKVLLDMNWNLCYSDQKTLESQYRKYVV
jgi:hypothetical protein